MWGFYFAADLHAAEKGSFGDQLTVVQLIGILTVLVTVELFSGVQETRKHNFEPFDVYIDIYIYRMN